jgi:hypothetical protein
MTSAVRTLPAAWAVLEGALRERRPVVVSYHGRRRLLCPHALGWKAGRAMLLGYQTGGETSTGLLSSDPCQRWRCFYVDEVASVLPAEAGSPWATAENYNSSRPFPSVDEVTVAVPSTDEDLTGPVR